MMTKHFSTYNDAVQFARNTKGYVQTLIDENLHCTYIVIYK